MRFPDWIKVPRKSDLNRFNRFANNQQMNRWVTAIEYTDRIGFYSFLNLNENVLYTVLPALLIPFHLQVAATRSKTLESFYCYLVSKTAMCFNLTPLKPFLKCVISDHIMIWEPNAFFFFFSFLHYLNPAHQHSGGWYKIVEVHDTALGPLPLCLRTENQCNRPLLVSLPPWLEVSFRA